MRAMPSTPPTGATKGRKRLVPPVLVRPSATGSSATPGGGGCCATTRAMDVPVVTDSSLGAIGMDLNADRLAVAETDASGNWVKAWRVPLVTYGKSQHQAEAVIGDAVASVVECAREVGKPIVIEKLDFHQKKAVLEGESYKYSRMMSSFSYGKVKACFLLPWLPSGSGGTSGQPGLQFSNRPGEVHGAVRTDGTPGSGPGAGPTLARLFGTHPSPVGLHLSATAFRSPSPYLQGSM